jgi:hypothetical protein
MMQGAFRDSHATYDRAAHNVGMSANPYSIETPARPFHFSMRALLIGVAVLGAGFGLIYSAYRSAQMSAWRMSEANNLRNVALALHNYHEGNKTFPPAIFYDAQGQPHRSWRVAIMPYVESSNFYTSYQHQQPWNSPANSNLCDVSVSLFRAPDQQRGVRHTNIVMPIGPGTVGEQATSMEDITDGNSNTIFLLALKPSDILWHEPRDLSINDITRAPGNPKRILIQGKLFRGGLCAYVDGRVAMLPADLDYDKFIAMLTISGGEKIEHNE